MELGIQLLGGNLKRILVLKHPADLNLVVEGHKGRVWLLFFLYFFHMPTATYIFVLLRNFLSMSGLLNMHSYADKSKNA